MLETGCRFLVTPTLLHKVHITLYSKGQLLNYTLLSKLRVHYANPEEELDGKMMEG